MLEIARGRYGDPGAERGGRNDACTTVSTCGGDHKKKTGDGDTVLRSGAAIPKPVQKRADDPKATYGGRRVELQLETSHFQKTHTSTTALLSWRLQVRILFRRGGAAIAALSPALAVRVTVSGPRKFASLQVEATLSPKNVNISKYKKLTVFLTQKEEIIFQKSLKLFHKMKVLDFICVHCYYLFTLL